MEEEESLSKSQKKRDATALQKLGNKLIALPASTLDTIPLPALLRQAINDAKAITRHGGLRRQEQLIGKLMRDADHQAILEAYNKILIEGNARADEFHGFEQWRDKLIAGGKEALTEYISLHPTIDSQHLRQLIKKTVDEKDESKIAGAKRALFRFLRDN
jgi:ribosome-associated protein